MIDNNNNDIPEHLTKGELYAGMLGSRLAQDIEDNNEDDLEPDYVEDDCFDDEEVDSDEEAGDDSLAGEENYE